MKDNSYLELWQIHCSVEWNRLCKIGRRHRGVQVCDINLLFGSASGRDSVKRIFLARALAVFCSKE